MAKPLGFGFPVFDFAREAYLLGQMPMDTFPLFGALAFGNGMGFANAAIEVIWL